MRTQNVSEQNQKHFCVPATKFVSATNVARAGKRGNICVGSLRAGSLVELARERVRDARERGSRRSPILPAGSAGFLALLRPLPFRARVKQVSLLAGYCVGNNVFPTMCVRRSVKDTKEDTIVKLVSVYIGTNLLMLINRSVATRKTSWFSQFCLKFASTFNNVVNSSTA